MEHRVTRHYAVSTRQKSFWSLGFAVMCLSASIRFAVICCNRRDQRSEVGIQGTRYYMLGLGKRGMSVDLSM